MGPHASTTIHNCYNAVHSGKSTLLRALAVGVYDKIPGDGREFTVTDPGAVTIRAEDGRPVSGVDISPFISSLPNATFNRPMTRADDASDVDANPVQGTSTMKTEGSSRTRVGHGDLERISGGNGSQNKGVGKGASSGVEVGDEATESEDIDGVSSDTGARMGTTGRPAPHTTAGGRSAVTTECFSTSSASGSTSQAAYVMEALEANATALLLDEDTCAGNVRGWSRV